MEVSSASLKDGMLHINIDRIVPEDKKPKIIKIK
jgi:HSP20 family molecular chaperone IbpA